MQQSRAIIARILGFAILVNVVWACSGGDHEPGARNRVQTTPPILISGEGSLPAIENTVLLRDLSFADELTEDGFVPNRMRVVIDPDASTADVNDAIRSVNGEVVSMEPGSVFLTLKIPSVDTVEDIEPLVNSLLSSGVILMASPVHSTPVANAKFVNGQPPSGCCTEFSSSQHLVNSRAFALFNLTDYLDEEEIQIPRIVVLDYFRDDNEKADLSSLSYNEPFSPRPSDHGFDVSTVAGADYDDAGTVGILPVESEIIAWSFANDDWFNIIDAAGEVLDQFSDVNIVLNTSLGMNDYNRYSETERAIYALRWRNKEAEHRRRFIHTMSGGNSNLAFPGARTELNSPFTTAALFDNPCLIIEDDERRDLCQVLFDRFYLGTDSAERPRNVIVASNLEQDGETLNASSNLPSNQESEMAAVATDIRVWNGIDNTGTSFASPQFAAVSTVLWSLRPSAAPDEIVSLIAQTTRQTDSGYEALDAYRAVLAVDENLATASVRTAIFDVVDEDGVDGPDRQITRSDLQRFVAEINSRNGNLDYSRFDLNGDGHTGGDTLDGFDLDLDRSLGLLESFVTDTDVICFYRNTALFGDIPESELDSLLSPLCDEPEPPPPPPSDPPPGVTSINWIERHTTTTCEGETHIFEIGGGLTLNEETGEWLYCCSFHNSGQVPLTLTTNDPGGPVIPGSCRTFGTVGSYELTFGGLSGRFEFQQWRSTENGGCVLECADVQVITSEVCSGFCPP